MMHGHFKEITQVEIQSSQGEYVLTASRDFSVRLWESNYGTQLYLFLDVNCQNSDLISLVSISLSISNKFQFQTWQSSFQEFATLDLNQNIKIWSLESPKIQSHLHHCKSALKEVPDPNQIIDLVEREHFPKHLFNSVLKHVDDVRYLSNSHLLIIKSPT